MLTNYIKITLRNLRKEKLHALINISGLSLGITCCIILGLFLRSELTYDRHHLKHKQIFRIVNEVTNNDKVDAMALTPSKLGPRLARDYPEVEAYVRFNAIFVTGIALEFRSEEDAFYWDDVYFADENVFDIFTHEYVYGDPEGALSHPASMAVSESFAKKYFGDVNPIGKTLSSAVDLFTITLVFADLPENTHLKYDVLLSYNRFGNPLPDDAARGDEWMLTGYTYLLMPEGYKVESFHSIAESYYERYMKEVGEANNSTMKFWLEPLADIHLESDLLYDRPTGNKLHIYGFSAVALIILFVACINYINLATARSMRRGREVGMRKVLGVARPQLIAQFLGESVFFVLMALVIGIALVETSFAFTPISDLLGKHELMNFTEEPILLLWMLVLTLVVGLLSGIYPAFYLSSIPPISALTGTSRSGKWGLRIRQTLVFLQFTISIGVIASTLLIGIQLQYVANNPLGFNKVNQVMINLRGADLLEKFATLRNELLRNDRILAASMTDNVPGDIIPLTFSEVENNEGFIESQTVSTMVVGENFIEVLGIKLSLGRNFLKKFLTDVEAAVLVNETLVSKMGWTEPLGKRVMGRRVVGVVKDFHFSSLHQQVEPLVIVRMKDDYSDLPPGWRPLTTRTLVVNISGEEISKTLDYIEKVLTEFDPTHPFEYEFLDDALDQLYYSEQRLMRLTGIFSGVCILISCLGLFGLAAFTTEQRTKEIGIRKVLGATTFQIIIMLSRSILLIVLVGSVIASLGAYLVIDEWLTGFAYHTDINPLVFLFSAAFAMAVAFGTVVLQSFRTAQANPVEALRYE